MNYNVFHSTCRGDSHLESLLPCQDSSYSESVLENGLCDLLVVSDGHGSKEFFRSDRGARLAVEAAVPAVLRFVSGFDPGNGCPALVSRGIDGVTDCESEDFTPGGDPNEAAFRHLARFILARWHEAVTADWNADPPQEGESDPDQPPVRAYGCTLLVAFRTVDWWAAIQLGDGKILAFWPDGSWSEPVPWDSECFLNNTTSLCSHREDRFRYCYGTQAPPALFLGSDGMDDSFRLTSDLARFYGSVIVRLGSVDFGTVGSELAGYLPELSRKGSRDDMSVAFWADEDVLPRLGYAIRRREQESVLSELGLFRTALDGRISGLIDELSQLIKRLKDYEMPSL